MVLSWLGKLILAKEKSLLFFTFFCQFWKSLEVLAFKTLKHKGQAWVVFEDVTSATEALKRMQGFPFYDKPMVSFIASMQLPCNMLLSLA